MKLDKGFCVVFASAALALSSMSFVFCPTARAGDPVPAIPAVAARPAGHVPSEASKTAMSIEMDDDGDELLEHWGDPRYSREERSQMAGLAVLLTLAGAGAAWRRRTLRRFYAHG